MNTPEPNQPAGRDHSKTPIKVPRLGIIHLLAWAAVSAVLLIVLISIGFFSNKTDEHQQRHLLGIILEALFRILPFAAGVVGSVVIVRAKLRDRSGPLQPGHWILLITSFSLVSELVITLVFTAMRQCFGDLEFPTAYITYVSGIIPLATAVFYLVATMRLDDLLRWKIMFCGFAFFYVVVGFAMLLGPIVSKTIFYLALIPLAPLLVFLFPFNVVNDIVSKVHRDWLHWLGIAIVAIRVIEEISGFIVPRLLN